MQLSLVTIYLGCVALLSAFCLDVVVLPVFVKIVGVVILFFYSTLLLRHHSIQRVTYLCHHQFQCELDDGTVCFATLAEDSIFLHWFVLLRFIVKDQRKSYSVILFKGSEKFAMAQHVRQQVLFE